MAHEQVRGQADFLLEPYILHFLCLKHVSSGQYNWKQWSVQLDLRLINLLEPACNCKLLKFLLHE